VIRFGVVLTVVLAAMGLLAAGVLGNSLLLVYLAIGAAALAAVMLTVGVVIWREEVFGDSPAGQAADQVAGRSPALAAVGGPAAGGPAAGPSPAALSRHPDRPEHPERLDWLERPDQAERLGRSERPERPERSGRERSDRPERPERSEREHSERDEPQKLAEPAARLGSAVLGQSALRSATRSEAPPDATTARERPMSAAEQDSPARRETAAAPSGPRPQRALRSPSGAPPEPAPERPVPGPRRGDTPKSGEPAADDVWPRSRARREPAAESAAGIGAWSFFAKPTELSVTEADGGEAGGGEAGGGEAGGGDAGRPAVAQDAAAEVGDVRDPGEPSDAAATADAAEAAPDAAHQPGAEPAVSRDRATDKPAAQDEPAEPARPEQASAAAEQASAPDAAIAGLETTDEPAAGSTGDTPTGSAAGHGHAARDQGTEVTVVPGITRYHRGQCILIRFLGPEDLETMTLQAAEAASYTSCKACRPEQQLAGD
jgi:hypothetical protein